MGKVKLNRGTAAAVNRVLSEDEVARQTAWRLWWEQKLGEGSVRADCMSAIAHVLGEATISRAGGTSMLRLTLTRLWNEAAETAAKRMGRKKREGTQQVQWLNRHQRGQPTQSEVVAFATTVVTAVALEVAIESAFTGTPNGQQIKAEARKFISTRMRESLERLNPTIT